MVIEYKWTIRFSILTPILFIVCIFLMGGGHGWYAPTMLLYPWAMLNTVWQDHLSAPFMIAGLLQFIFYIFILNKSRGEKNQSWVVATILFSHIILATIILVLRSSEWR